MPFSEYKENGDGTLSFRDPATGQESPPMAGPAAQQMKLKIDAVQPSPELVAAAAKPADARLASNDPVNDAMAGVPGVVGNLFKGDMGAVREINPDQPKQITLPDQNMSAPEPGATGPGNIDPSRVRMAGGKSSGIDMPTVIPGQGGGSGKRVEVQTGRHVQEQQTVHNDADVVGYKQAGQAQYNAVDQQAEAEEAANNSIQAAKEHAFSDMTTNREAQRLAEIQRQEDGQRRLAELDQLRRTVPTEVKDYWADKKDGERGAAALFLGLGTLGSGIAGTQNHALTMYQDMVSKNLDKQKANIAAGRGKVEDARGVYADFLKQGMTEREAEHSYRAAMLEDAQRQLDVIATQTNNPKIKANAEARKAEIQAAYAKEQLDLNKTVMSQSKSYAQATVGGPGNQKVMFDDVKKDQTVRGPDGKTYEFGEGKTAQDAALRLGELGQNKRDADQLADIIKNPSYVLDPDKRGAARAIASRIAMHAGKAEGATARVNEGYFKAVEQAITNGDVNGLTNLGKQAALAEYRNGLTSEADGVIRQHAISQVKPFLLVDPKSGERQIKYIRSGNAPKQAPDVQGTQVGE